MDFWTDVRVVDESTAQSVREFLEAHHPGWDADPQQLRAFHHQLLQWRNAHLNDASPDQLAAYRQELARGGFDLLGMTTTAMVATVVGGFGTQQQQRSLVSLLESGEITCSLGYTEPDAGSDLAAARTRATRDGDQWVIDGSKMFTSHADINTHVFLLTRTSTAGDRHSGLTMFLVPLDAPGVEVRKVDTLGEHHTFMTHYDGVRVDDGARIGEVDDGWKVLRFALDIEHGAGPKRRRDSGAKPQREAPAIERGSGKTHDLLARTVEWARGSERHGCRVLDDPSVRERLARLFVEDEVVRLVLHRNDPPRSQPGVGNAAKLLWTEAYVQAAAECMDIAGLDGPPFFEEAFRDAPVFTVMGGCSEVQRDVIAERRLGLPNSRRG